ncbi:MAG: glycosyltransferase family 39 protein [Anaerolineae bacterium]|nr:glycosyltransferase family 39 protein [Anaerolineae bacterium]
MPNKRTLILLALILIAAAVFRLYGLKWDDDIPGYPHPDERHLANTMSHIGLRLPEEPKSQPINWQRLNDPAYSALNPRRLIPGSEDEHYDLAYGTFPIYIYRLTAVILSKLTANPVLDDYYSYGLIGRGITALFSLLTVFWVYRIGECTFDATTALLGAAFLALCVLHIQLSHFMTVDLLMTAMLTAGLLVCIRFAQGGHTVDALGMGALLGLSMACKFNGVTLGAGIAAAYGIAWLGGKRNLGDLLLYCVPSTLLFWLVGFGAFEYFALRDPYTYIHAIGVQAKMVSGETDWPYTRQYVNTAPYLFQLKNLVVWGMGGALGAAAVGGTLWALVEQVAKLIGGERKDRFLQRSRGWLRRWFDNPRRAGVLVLLGWALPFFLYTARIEVKFLRYMLPLTPLLCLFAADVTLRLGRWLAELWRLPGKTVVRWGLAALTLIASLLWSVAYMRVYAQEHPWQAASRWFYENAPKGSFFTWEAWGDPIPVNLPALNLHRQAYGYRDVWMQPYSDMQPQDKLDHIIESLREADYITLATPRIYLSVARLPWRYPVDIRYYDLLLQEQLGYQLKARFTAWPGLGPIEINDLGADQSFFDYEHPLVLVFKKTRDLTDQEWQDLFADQLQIEPQFTRQGAQPPIQLPIPHR